MNFPKLKRRILHIFFLTGIFMFVATPVYAVTIDLTSPNSTNVISVNEPVPLTKPEPVESTAFIGPTKPPEPISEEAPEPTPSPTPKSSPSAAVPSPTPSPTVTATATPTPTTSASTGSNTSTGGGLNADILFDMSNSYRTGKGLPPFQKDERICSLAAARAPEIAAEIAEGHMHSGKDSHNFPYRFTENIITMRSEAAAFNWWVNDEIHRIQIEASNTHSCVACSGNACTQEFTSFNPK